MPRQYWAVYSLDDVSVEAFFPQNVPLFRTAPDSTKAEFLWDTVFYLGRNSIVVPVAKA